MIPTTPTTASDIRSRHWQHALGAVGGDGSDRLGQIVEAVDDVAQAIRIVLTTPRGTDRLRPEFGLDILPLLDRPATQMLPALIRDARAAIARWEPRAELLSVTGRVDGPQAILTLIWRLAGTDADPETLQQPYGQRAGGGAA